MHDKIDHHLGDAIDSMNDVEKIDLMEKLAQSLQPTNDRKNLDKAAEAKKGLLASIRRISSLPMEGPGGFSGMDHDQVLCGLETQDDAAK